MRWEQLKKAAEILGFVPRALRSRGERGTWPRSNDEGKGSGTPRYDYCIPESRFEADKMEVDRYVADGQVFEFDSKGDVAPVDSAPAEDVPPIVSQFAGDGDKEEEDAFDEEGNDFDLKDDGTIKRYDFIGNKYVFSLKSKPGRPFVVDKSVVEDIVEAYTHDGGGAAVNEIVRAHGIQRKTVKQMLTALGITKDDLPFTREAILARDASQLEDDLVAKKAEKVLIRAERRDWKKVRDMADRAQRWETFFKDTLEAVKLDSYATSLPKYKAIVKPTGLTAVSHATDLHYGKLGWVDQIGEPFNRGICRERLLESTDGLISRINSFGGMDEVIIGVGGDWFHIDNQRQQTTRGTPQDADGTFMQIFSEGCQLAFDHIEMWRRAVPKVKVVKVRGNHDYMSTSFLVNWLQAMYKDAEDVDVSECHKDRHYEKVGNTLLGLTHGDSTKDKDLGSLMALEAKQHWSDTKYRLWLTGHWHSQIVSESYGVLVEHLPSLAGTDAWHKAHGYVGNRKGLMAHVIDHQDGVVAKVLYEPKV